MPRTLRDQGASKVCCQDTNGQDQINSAIEITMSTVHGEASLVDPAISPQFLSWPSQATTSNQGVSKEEWRPPSLDQANGFPLRSEHGKMMQDESLDTQPDLLADWDSTLCDANL